MNDDRSTVLAANEDFYQAFRHRDLAAMRRVWSQGTGSLCIHPGGRVLRGWTEIEHSWEIIFAKTEYLEIETEIAAVEVTEAIAHVVAIETVLQSTRGRRSKAQSVATNIFQNMAQKWYLVHHHGSPILR